MRLLASTVFLASAHMALSLAEGSTIAIHQPDYLTLTDLPGVGFGQSFTANGTYSIVAIDVVVSASSGGVGVTVEVRDFDASVPSLGASLLGSGTIRESQLSPVPAWVRVHLMAPVHVVQGGEYAFTLVADEPGSSETGYNRYGYNRNDVYSGGRYFPITLSARTSDLAFAIIVPEPSVWCFFGVGCVLWVSSRRRRNH